MTPHESARRSPGATGLAAGPGDLSALLEGLREGDHGALSGLLRHNRHRLERVLRVRLMAQLRHLFDRDALPPETVRAALRSAPVGEAPTEARVLLWLADLLEGETRRGVPSEAGHEAARELRLVDSGGDAAQQAKLEHLLDDVVAGIEPPELREVLLLRDYCGGNWELVREKLDLLSTEAAQELYRRAHDQLGRRLRPHLPRKG